MIKQSDTAKDQYKFLKDQKNNVVDNNREDGVKTEDGETIDNMHNRCNDSQYRNLVNDTFTNKLKDGELHLTNFVN